MPTQTIASICVFQPCRQSGSNFKCEACQYAGTWHQLFAEQCFGRQKNLEFDALEAPVTELSTAVLGRLYDSREEAAQTPELPEPGVVCHLNWEPPGLTPCSQHTLLCLLRGFFLFYRGILFGLHSFQCTAPCRLLLTTF